MPADRLPCHVTQTIGLAQTKQQRELSEHRLCWNVSPVLLSLCFFPHRVRDRSEDKHLCDEFRACVGHRHGECFSSTPPVFNHQRESSDTSRSSIFTASSRFTLIKKKREKKRMRQERTQHLRLVTNKLPFFYLQDDKVPFQRQDCKHLMSAESNISRPLPMKALMCSR